MRIIKDIKNIRQKFKNPVLTIGMFDGVHLAHQKIIKKVIERSKSEKGTSIVLTFTPHPVEIVKKDAANYMITTLKQRLDLLKSLNVDICLLLDFNQVFSQIPAEKFIKDVLIDTIGINYLIVGKGFRFGRNKGGSFSLLKRFSKKYGFKIKQIDSVKRGDQVISSSRIRALIQKGKITQANKLLGRRFSLHGEIVRGSTRGRILGYPTANIKPAKELMPNQGVYAVLVKLANNIFSGVLNIGSRPTFSIRESGACTIEVHIFNFGNRIYGQRLEIFFVGRIRNEHKFSSQEALSVQIAKDVLKAKKILKLQRTLP